MAKSLDRLVTENLRQLASEKTEIGSDGETLISRAAKLALTMWHIALGTGPIMQDSKTGLPKRPKPDAEMIKIILERLEGKVLSTEELQKKDESIPDRISRIGRDRVNKISGEMKNE
jgi:hypothetical protein